MKQDKKFYMECHLAGRQYHDADEVWDELKVGTQLRLERDFENRYDPQAVAVIYTKKDEDSLEPSYTDYLIGYIPQAHNDDISKFLEMGWNNIFECRICKINPEVHYEQQIRITIKIKRNQESEI